MLFALFIVLLVAAALIDLRARVCPNGVSAALALVSIVYILQGFGVADAFWRVLLAVLICSALVAFELVWRRFFGRVGIGMGDVKVFFSLVVVSPQLAVISFCAALIMLAVYCAARRQGTAPLLPFLSGCFLLAHLVFAGYRLWA